jgi:hypothetical protein
LIGDFVGQSLSGSGLGSFGSSGFSNHSGTSGSSKSISVISYRFFNFANHFSKIVPLNLGCLSNKSNNLW